jgi:hypothetical protein
MSTTAMTTRSTAAATSMSTTATTTMSTTATTTMMRARRRAASSLDTEKVGESTEKRSRSRSLVQYLHT